MRTIRFVMAFAILSLPVACSDSSSPGREDARGATDTAGVAKDTTGDDAATRDTAPVSKLDAGDGPSANDVGLDATVAPSNDATTPEIQGDTGRDAAAGRDTAKLVGLDGAAAPGLDGAAAPGLDGAKPLRLDGATDLGIVVDGGGPQVTLRKGGAYGNCMPSIRPDPIIVTWTVDITGARGATAKLTSATLTVVGDVTIVQEFEVDNPTIALTGGAGSADQRKPIEDQQPNSACEMCGDATYQLDLEFEVDGQSILVSRPGNFSCAY